MAEFFACIKVVAMGVDLWEAIIDGWQGEQADGPAYSVADLELFLGQKPGSSIRSSVVRWAISLGRAGSPARKAQAAVKQMMDRQIAKPLIIFTAEQNGRIIAHD